MQSTASRQWETESTGKPIAVLTVGVFYYNNQ